MRMHYGSWRYLLQAAHYRTAVPSNFRPYNRKWQFNTERHGPALMSWVKAMRRYCDELEAKFNESGS